MKSVNKIILVGCLGHDPEFKDAAKVKIAKLSIATNSNVKDDAGHWSERTEWHIVILWDRLAEIAKQYLKKGSKVYVEGRLQTRIWEDKKSGEKKYRTEVIGSDLVILADSRRANGSDVERPSQGSDSSTHAVVDESPF